MMMAAVFVTPNMTKTSAPIINEMGMTTFSAP